jgi:hypothetical protein
MRGSNRRRERRAQKVRKVEESVERQGAKLRTRKSKKIEILKRKRQWGFGRRKAGEENRRLGAKVSVGKIETGEGG